MLVPPLGPVVAISGSVKRPAIYEMKPGSRLTELLTSPGADAVVRPPAVPSVSPGSGASRTQHDRRGSGRRAWRLRGGEKSGPGSRGAIRFCWTGLCPHRRLPTQITNVVSLVGCGEKPGTLRVSPGMQVKDLLSPDQLTVDAYADQAEIIRTDPVTYQTKVIQFSPKAVLEGRRPTTMSSSAWTRW
ncbi:MAG: SLBB domain-containing protein [Nitrospira sp.]|nr:SLBB domain-containing protein [Nitrospira sp.]